MARHQTRIRDGRKIGRGTVVLLTCLFATTGHIACAGGTGVAGDRPSASLDLAREQRVAAIGYRLAQDAVGACQVPAPLTGMGLHDISSYAERYRAMISKAYDLTNGFGVRFVVRGSAAERAGISAGDEIVALEGAGASDIFSTGRVSALASPDRTQHFVDRLEALLALQPALLWIRHNGTPHRIALTADRGCGGHFIVADDPTLNAWSDGSGVAVSARLVDLVGSDDELAFVLAHEMSHNILHHAMRTKGRSPVLAEFGIGAGLIKATEIEADALAVELMLRAGYSPDGADAFLRRLARSRGPSLALTHPGTEQRIRMLHAAVKRQHASAPIHTNP